ncbi:MAG: hypothetical protein IPM74_04100 [Crocinitomicaceae bacterium]|nr:hypothetical protein [Crocinitomicaceae bacterium]MBK8925090.1 hypothetical protein [Crocinitomicaceae bacterium]
MRRIILLSFFTLMIGGSFAQTGCYTEWKTAFDERGSYAIGDEVHRNVYIAFVEDGESYCVQGKARVEYGKIVSIWFMFEDGTYDLMESDKFTNKAKAAPGIVNGISEEIITKDGEHFYIIFVDKIKPKKKSYKTVGGPPSE